jgi:hypothetical protein
MPDNALGQACSRRCSRAPVLPGVLVRRSSFSRPGSQFRVLRPQRHNLSFHGRKRHSSVAISASLSALDARKNLTHAANRDARRISSNRDLTTRLAFGDRRGPSHQPYSNTSCAAKMSARGSSEGVCPLTGRNGHEKSIFFRRRADVSERLSSGQDRQQTCQQESKDDNPLCLVVGDPVSL